MNNDLFKKAGVFLVFFIFMISNFGSIVDLNIKNIQSKDHLNIKNI